MKKQNVIIWIGVFVLSVGSLFAQDKKMDAEKAPKEDMNMSEMSKSPHHIAMMAYRQSVLTFATALRDLARDGNVQDVDLARDVFAEIKRNVGEMDRIHQSHMSKMNPAMREKMKPMMEKMQAEGAAMNGRSPLIYIFSGPSNPTGYDPKHLRRFFAVFIQPSYDFRLWQTTK